MKTLLEMLTSKSAHRKIPSPNRRNNNLQYAGVVMVKILKQLTTTNVDGKGKSVTTRLGRLGKIHHRNDQSRRRRNISGMSAFLRMVKLNQESSSSKDDVQMIELQCQGAMLTMARKQFPSLQRIKST
ncbi:hypothetical protein T11_13014 [Trichinella zimbabwensis]|uniref:Uncharacterized protein n=1 Tax=Trichinella zimbabwensis TaxID=268475 RepID=A0A0V1HYX9_9BILA|nr:hypothetical protein T11_13014 [Trichinella zimbabwensis]